MAEIVVVVGEPVQRDGLLLGTAHLVLPLLEQVLNELVLLGLGVILLIVIVLVVSASRRLSQGPVDPFRADAFKCDWLALQGLLPRHWLGSR